MTVISSVALGLVKLPSLEVAEEFAISLVEWQT